MYDRFGADSLLGFLHRVDVGKVVDDSEVHIASIFVVEMCKASHTAVWF
jgi:hypothetical protein